MKTIVIQTGNNENARFLLNFAGKMKMKVRVIDEEELEDSWFASMIDEGMKEDGEVPIEKVLKKLQR